MILHKERSNSFIRYYNIHKSNLKGAFPKGAFPNKQKNNFFTRSLN